MYGGFRKKYPPVSNVRTAGYFYDLKIKKLKINSLLWRSLALKFSFLRIVYILFHITVFYLKVFVNLFCRN